MPTLAPCARQREIEVFEGNVGELRANEFEEISSSSEDEDDE